MRQLRCKKYQFILKNYDLESEQKVLEGLTFRNKISDLLHQRRGALGAVIRLISQNVSADNDLVNLFLNQGFQDDYENLYELIETLKNDNSYRS